MASARLAQSPPFSHAQDSLRNSRESFFLKKNTTVINSWGKIKTVKDVVAETDRTRNKRHEGGNQIWILIQDLENSRTLAHVFWAVEGGSPQRAAGGGGRSLGPDAHVRRASLSTRFYLRMLPARTSPGEPPPS